MSVMDKLKQMLKGHEEQAGKGVDKGGDYVDGRTQGSTAGRSTPRRRDSGSSWVRSRPGRAMPDERNRPGRGPGA